VKLMPPEVSLPAQAVSTIGNSATAKNLADIDKGNPAFQDHPRFPRAF
jgi:hypothetical protein